MGEVSGHTLFSNDEFGHRKAVQFSSFLQLLLEANEYSSDLTISPWEFSVDLAQARTMGINLNDLRWMIGRSWIQCHQGESEAEDLRNATNEKSQSSRYIILDSGVTALRCVREGDASTAAIHTVKVAQAFGGNFPKEDSTPQWNVERRELTVLGTVVKRFRWPAPNQETILSVFSEEGWPSRIEDPLPQGNGLDPKRRLGDTIKCLNLSLIHI